MSLPEPIPQPIEAPHLPSAEAPATTSRSFERRVLGLAAPVIGESLLQTMLSVVDIVLVAWLRAVALAGIGTALQVIFVLIGALSALSVGASVQVAQAFGAGDLPAASRFARQALLWSAIISVPLALLGILLTPTMIGLF